ncbi:uncharacterized protein [Castor canadensis]|uniref:Uncharacterized protein n=1 Tax=Castor canadensis TaxID=51338 RepID=A0AC58LUC0_CASCN
MIRAAPTIKTQTEIVLDYLSRCKNILKIKCVIPLHIVWMDKVEEGDSEAKKSFLLGWPMENFRATFLSLEQKEKWCSLLERNINLTKEKDNQKTLELPIFIKDIQHSPVAVTATSFDTVNDIIKKTLSIIGITECENEYLLSFNSGKEEAPFTLLGHECPYAIKMNYLGEKAFMPQRPSKLTSQTFQEPIQEQVSPDLKGQFFLGPRHPNKDKGRYPFRNWRFCRRSRSSHNNLGESPPTIRTELHSGVSTMNICEGSPRATPMIHVDVPDARDSPGSASTLNFCDPVREQEVSLDELDQPVALPGPSPKGEESARVNEMTHVIVTDSRDAVETVCAPSLLDCSQDPKGSLDEPDLSITPPGPPPAGEGSPRATPMIHVDVPDARDSPGSASTLNFCDPVREQEVSLDELDQPVALPGPSPKGEESARVNEMTHVIVTDSRDAVETVCAPSLLDCSQDPKGSLDEPDLSITPPGPPPAGEGSPRATPMIHVDVPDARDSPGSASTLNFCDPVREQEVSLDELDQPVALPGPSPKGTPWSIPSNDPSQIIPPFP